jgi:hypothetical protein
MKLTNKHTGSHKCAVKHMPVTLAEITMHYRRLGYTSADYGSTPYIDLARNMTDEEIMAAKFTPEQDRRYRETGNADGEA